MTNELNPSMRRSWLIATLRDPKLWPEGFKWNFGICSSCAIGLCVRSQFGRNTRNSDDDKFYPEEKFLCSELDLTEAEFDHVFIKGWDKPHTVSPENIADRLEFVHRAKVTAE